MNFPFVFFKGHADYCRHFLTRVKSDGEAFLKLLMIWQLQLDISPCKTADQNALQYILNFRKH